jgi:hypothetical protein
VGTLPIAFGIFFSLFWLVYLLVKKVKSGTPNWKEWLKDLRLRVSANFFIIVQVLYPSISKYCFTLFDCTSGPNHQQYLKRDLTITCWGKDHLKICLSIGLPIFIVWIIGFPVFILNQMRRNLPKLRDKQVIQEYGMFYIGLKDDSYYWDVLISNLRKVLFITIITFFLPNATSEMIVSYKFSKLIFRIIIKFNVKTSNSLVDHLDLTAAYSS